MASRIRRWLLPLILITGCSYLFAQTASLAKRLTEPGASGAQVWGDPVGGLQMSLYLAPQQTDSRMPSLKLGLRNVGSSDITVTLGFYCGLPDDIEPTSIELIFIDDQGKSQRLHNDGLPNNAMCGGEGVMTVWQEHISPGGTISIPIHLIFYRQEKNPTKKPGWQPGSTYLLQATFPAEADYKRFPQYAAKSNQLPVYFPAE